MQNTPAKIGVLLTNLGTPDAPRPKAVRRYLSEFLKDRRIVEIPKPIWWLILHGIVLRIRPKQSAKLYRNIWLDEGSPLLVHSKQQQIKLQNYLNQKYNDKILLQLAMRYGKPSIAHGLVALQEANARQLLIFPLYPQYSATTVASTFDAVAKVLKKSRWLPELRTISGYADHEGYIHALTNSIQTYWQQQPRGEKLLFSFHGIPRRNFDLGDPYYCFCHKTTRLVVEQLNLAEDEWQLVFQSRFGKQEWLKPYCVETLQQLAKDGVNNVDVVCPGFAADCLETLEEIAITNQAIFTKAGGKQLNYIPALNADDQHIHALANVIEHNVQGWI